MVIGFRLFITQRRNLAFTIWTYRSGVSNLFGRRTTTVTVGWFAGRKCKNHSKCYTYRLNCGIL